VETEERRSVQFEPSDISVPGVLFTGLGVLVCTIAIVSIMYLLFSYMRSSKLREAAPPSPLSRDLPSLPPEPRLQASPSLDYRTMRDQANWELNHYQWIDRQKGIVAIPIDRAMDLVVQRGIPPSSLPASQFFKPQEGDRLTGFSERKEPEP
jgi:hypothetical protein